MGDRRPVFAWGAPYVGASVQVFTPTGVMYAALVTKVYGLRSDGRVIVDAACFPVGGGVKPARFVDRVPESGMPPVDEYSWRWPEVSS